MKTNKIWEKPPIGVLTACATAAASLFTRSPAAVAQTAAPAAPATAPAQTPATNAGGTSSAAPATPQTPGTNTAPGTSAGASTGQTTSPVAGQATGATPTATASSDFGSSTASGTSATGAQAAPASGGGSLPNTNTRPDDPRFDLARTIRTAIDSSSSLQQARRNVEIDQKRTDEEQAQQRPSITGNGSASRFDAATKVKVGGGDPLQVLPDHTESLSIAISERLDLLGQVRASVNQARLQAAADRYIINFLTNQRVLQADQIYFNLLRAIHQVQVANAALQSAREQQAIANRLYLGQIGQKIDYLRATTQVAQAEQNLRAAENQRDIAREAFNDLTGRPLDASVVLLDTPGVTVGADVPAPVVNAPVGTTPAAAPAFVPFAPPVAEVNAVRLDQSLRDAQTLRPEILQNAVLVRVSETGVRIARFGQEPTFALSASGNYYPTPSFQTPRQRTAALTATVSIPFYDGGATRARIAEARLRRENAQTTLESSRSDVALDVREAYLNLQTAARQIASANTALEQAVAARQLAQVRYEGQVGLYLEVTDAQSALVRAQNTQVDTVYDYLIARARFENAVGAPQVPAPGTLTTGTSTAATALPAPTQQP